MAKQNSETFHPVPEFPAQKVAIIGTARSGTYFTYELLKRLGTKVKHEGDRRNDVQCDILVSWTAVSRNSIATVPLVLHQVRDPIKAISSAQILSDKAWEIAAKTIPVETDDPLPLLAARYWLGWNTYCELFAHKRYQVEQLSDDAFFTAWCGWMGIEADLEKRDSVPTDKNTKTGRYRELTYDDIAWYDQGLADLIVEKAREYGYTAP